jgi:hypothetical protein
MLATMFARFLHLNNWFIGRLQEEAQPSDMKGGKPAETGCLATASDDMLVVASKLAEAVIGEKGIPWKID